MIQSLDFQVVHCGVSPFAGKTAHPKEPLESVSGYAFNPMVASSAGAMNEDLRPTGTLARGTDTHHQADWLLELQVDLDDAGSAPPAQSALIRAGMHISVPVMIAGAARLPGILYGGAQGFCPRLQGGRGFRGPRELRHLGPRPALAGA